MYVKWGYCYISRLTRGLWTRKVEELQALLKSMSDCEVVPTHRLASVVGKIMSMSWSLGHSYKNDDLQSVLNKSVSWYQEISLIPEALQEVKFWLTEFVKFIGQRIWPKPSAVRVVYSNASGTGYVWWIHCGI